MPTVELTRRDEFALLTLNRPDALNALSFEIIRAIGQALDEVADSDARTLLIVGAGDKSFCAGADIKELQNRSLIEQKTRRRTAVRRSSPSSTPCLCPR